MKKIIILALGLVLFLGTGFYVYKNYYKWPWFSNLNPGGGKFERKENKLEKYDFDSLKKRGGIGSDIKIEGETVDVNIRRLNAIKATLPKKKQKLAQSILNKSMTWKSEIFSFQSNGKKISGMINTPMTPMSNKMPAIIMIRGFAEGEGYYSGSGTWKVADELAKNGYVTVSLDFLGYGLSNNESADSLEARFEKVESVMDLIESVKRLPYVDSSKIGIWAHSNGGQIALSTLEVSSADYPTVLWAPMTNPFPQSVLDTADSGTSGDPIRKLISDFGKRYDPRRYAVENYYQWIEAPVIIHQGTADVWCNVDWQQEVVNKLKALGKSATLYVYQGDDHNLKNSWNQVVGQDIGFFNSILKK